MPLPPAAAREKLHRREILCEGFRRDDGLWDIEARLCDTKTYAFTNRERGEIAPGVPVHEMRVRITIDLDMRIHDAHTEVTHAPFSLCPGAQVAMKHLIGMRIQSGWLRRARKQITPRESCTHLFELLRPLATTAYQTIHRAREARAERTPNRDRPGIIDQCYALASDRAVVAVEWPRFYTGEGEG